MKKLALDRPHLVGSCDLISALFPSTVFETIESFTMPCSAHRPRNSEYTQATDRAHTNINMLAIIAEAGRRHSGNTPKSPKCSSNSNEPQRFVSLLESSARMICRPKHRGRVTACVREQTSSGGYCVFHRSQKRSSGNFSSLFAIEHGGSVAAVKKKYWLISEDRLGHVSIT